MTDLIEEGPVRLDTIGDLLAVIDRLPAPERWHARGRVAAAIEQPAPAARAALGLLALDLAAQLGRVGQSGDGGTEFVIDLAEPAAATA